MLGYEAVTGKLLCYLDLLYLLGPGTFFIGHDTDTFTAERIHVGALELPRWYTTFKEDVQFTVSATCHLVSLE